MLTWLIWAGAALAAPAFALGNENRRHRRRYLHVKISEVDRMSGVEFEDFLKAHFEALGYHAAATPKSGDFGADLVLTRGRDRIVLQAKRHVKSVGIAAIQQVIGAKSYYGAPKGIVVTNNYFTSSAVQLARRSGVELWDRNKLQKIMRRNASGSREKITVGKGVGKCPLCGGDLILRMGKHGAFYGCEHYPDCKYTRAI